MQATHNHLPSLSDSESPELPSVIVTARALVFALAAGLSACGGGSSAPSELKVQNVRATGVAEETYEGFPLPDLTVTFDFSGDPNQLLARTFFINVADPNLLYESTVGSGVALTATGNVLRLRGRAHSPGIGTFRGPLVINLCLDATCATKIAEGLAVDYTANIRAGIRFVSPQTAVIRAFGEVGDAVRHQVSIPPSASSVRLAVEDQDRYNFPFIYFPLAEVLAIDTTSPNPSATWRIRPAPVGGRQSIFVRA